MRRRIVLLQRGASQAIVVLGNPSPGFNLPVLEAFEMLDGLSVVVDDVIYMPSLDHPEDRPHPFVYFIKIRNNSDQRVSIQGRKWLVHEDQTGELLVVEGDGVVGQKPNLGPVKSFPTTAITWHGEAGTLRGLFSD